LDKEAAAPDLVPSSAAPNFSSATEEAVAAVVTRKIIDFYSFILNTNPSRSSGGDFF